MPKIEPFEKYAGQYEDWFEKNRFVYESELEAVKAQMPEGGDCIEIGVGSGKFALPPGIKLVSEIKDIEPFREGHGEGSFFVVKAMQE